LCFSFFAPIEILHDFEVAELVNCLFEEEVVKLHALNQHRFASASENLKIDF
jgi:hypothetical protein